MAGLKEIKGHIASVRSTLKITSAMKMVSSAKLRKAQAAAEAMRPYEAALRRILMAAGGLTAAVPAGDGAVREVPQTPGFYPEAGPDGKTNVRGAVAIVAIASNSSLCGGFNANVIREVRARVSALRSEGADVVVYSLGRKMSDAMRRDGYASPADCNHLVGKTRYDDVAALASDLTREYSEGRVARVELIYNHFVSTSTQRVVSETYLPFGTGGEVAAPPADDLYIIEPDRSSILEALLPKVIRLKLYAAVLDSVASEHAARTVAMQTASDNAEELLRTLTLEYNKSRQQKITAEILDLAAGAAL